MLNLQPTTYDQRLKILFVFVVSCWLLVVGQIAYAATAVIEIDTGRETINALEGTLVLPSGAKIDTIYTGNSAILIWITPPEIEGNTIKFAGITPGGFRGRYPVFSFDSASGVQNYSFKSVNAIRSDSSGTSVPVKLIVSPGEIAEDTVPPEPFDILSSKTPEAFAGRYFASFLAQDKGTGVEKYEYALIWILPPDKNDWREAESPLVLNGLDVFKTIYVRAADHNGNYRAVSTAGPYRHASILIGSIIVVCVLLFLKRSFYSRS